MTSLRPLSALLVPALLAAQPSAESIRVARHPPVANEMGGWPSVQDDLRVADANGDRPRRLTVHVIRGMMPRFSPDGTFNLQSSSVARPVARNDPHAGVAGDLWDLTKPNHYGIILENHGVALDVWVQNGAADELTGTDRERLKRSGRFSGCGAPPAGEGASVWSFGIYRLRLRRGALGMG